LIFWDQNCVKAARPQTGMHATTTNGQLHHLKQPEYLV